jgi:hypothetical protein
LSADADHAPARASIEIRAGDKARASGASPDLGAAIAASAVPFYEIKSFRVAALAQGGLGDG